MADEDLRRRRRVLFVMLTVLDYREPPGGAPALPRALRRWLGGWRGIGRIVIGMSRQGFDLVLTQYGAEGWRATFYPAGRGTLRHVSRRVGLGARAVDGGTGGGVGKPAEA